MVSYCCAICGFAVRCASYSAKNFCNALASKRPVCWLTKGVWSNIGFVPSLSTFCISVSVTRSPSSFASFSISFVCTKVFQTMSFTWLSCSSFNASAPCCIFTTSLYSSTSFWKSFTLIFSPKTSPTCWRSLLRVDSHERKASSAINANRPKPMIPINRAPLLLIFPNAAITLICFLFFSYFFLCIN